LLTPYDPQNLNPYSYARNNPIGLSDPSGLVVADSGGPTCLTLNTCEEETDPGPGEIQLPVSDWSGDPDCDGSSTVCNGIVYPTNNYGAANNVLYVNPETGRVTAYSDPDYVSPEYSWGDFGAKVVKGTANLLILDAVRACTNGDPSCAVEFAAVFFKPVKGLKYADDVIDAASPAIKVGSSGGKTAGERFSKKVRLAVLDENPSTCVYCRMETDRPQVDHVIARSRGGDATVENGQTTCPWCNNSKNNRDFPVNPPPGFEGQWPPPWWGGQG
jgi:hypothetical protein